MNERDMTLYRYCMPTVQRWGYTYDPNVPNGERLHPASELEQLRQRLAEVEADLVDMRKSLPALILNPDAWPENYAYGFNDAMTQVNFIFGLPSYLCETQDAEPNDKEHC